MSLACAALLAAFLLAGSRAGAVPSQTATRDWSASLGEGALEELFSAAVRRGAGALERRELGRSTQGLALELLALGGAGPAPALLVCTDPELEHPDGSVAGPEAALFLLEALLERRERDAAFAALLERARLELVPLLAPDPPAPAKGPGLNHNRAFPSGWEPWAAPSGTRLGHGGPFPLSAPEGLALARHLVGEPSLVALVLLTRRPGLLLDEPGSLARFAARELGLGVIVLPAWEGARVETPLGPAPEGFRAAAERVAGLLAELPRLALAPSSLERLRADLWQLELGVERAGELWPRVESLPAARRAAARLALEVEGAELQLVALRHGSAGPFAPAGTERLAEALAAKPDERLELRLLLRAAEGSSLAIGLRSLLTGRGEMRVLLK